MKICKMELKKITVVCAFILSGHLLMAQEIAFNKIEPAKIAIDTGVFAGYARHELASFYLLIGSGENNLKFNIVGKSSNSVSFSYDNSFSDAQTLVPAVFVNKADETEILLMIEIAAETSWGQELLYIQGEAVNYIGFLEYAVALEDDSSIAGHCRVFKKGKKIVIAMDPVPIIDYTSGERLVNGDNLKIEINTAKMKMKVK